MVLSQGYMYIAAGLIADKWLDQLNNHLIGSYSAGQVNCLFFEVLQGVQLLGRPKYRLWMRGWIQFNSLCVI